MKLEINNQYPYSSYELSYFFFLLEGGVGVDAYSRLGVYKLFYLQGGRLFEVGPYSRLGT